MNNKMQPLISVIIPVHNAGKYISDSLESIFSQGIEDIEIICVDDGSEDDSLEILQSYCNNDRRIKVLHQKNQFAGVARNNGIEIARGKYLSFIDADDLLLPGSLKYMLTLAEQNSLDLLKTGFIYEDVVSGEKYTDLYSELSCMSPLNMNQAISFSVSPARLLHVPDAPWNGLYLRKFVQEHKLRFNNLRCANDRSFYISCLLNARRIMTVRRPTVCYRTGQSGQLINRRAEHFETQFESYELIRKLCEGSSFAKTIMRHELVNVFDWHRRLITEPQHKDKLDAQLKEFLQSYDATDVGEDFLSSFAYSDIYYKFARGETAPPRPSPVVRALRCWQEHGMKYTVLKFLGKENHRCLKK